MFHQTSGNPFEEEPLTKAYYFPSLEKHLSTNQKKTCLSPNRETNHPKQTSNTDAKFLRESNKFSSHELPTREDGTIQHELSSGSQFNESWPSTERNVSSSSQNTPLSSSTPAEKEINSVKTSNKYLHEDKISHPSTLSKYVDRFRRGTPTSREERHSSDTSSSKDFWWLSPPSNTSTPKEPSDSITSKITKNGLKRNQFSRPVREAAKVLDSNIDGLLARTNQLLETSGNTLSEDSSESIPKPPSSWMIEKQKRLDNAVKSKTPTVGKSRPAPEDDILYQWRLSRRLEKAQGDTKAARLDRLANTVTHRTAVVTHCRYNAYLPEQDHPAKYHMDSEYRKDDVKSSDNRCIKHLARTHVDKIADCTTDHMPLRDKGGVFAMREQENVDCREKDHLSQEAKNNQVAPLESNIPAVCFINNEEKLPSHVHMMCDIVPCSKQMYLKPDSKHDVHVKKCHPNVSDVNKHTVERGQKARAECDSPDVQDQECLQKESSCSKGDIAEKPMTHALPAAVASRHQITTAHGRRREDTNTCDDECLHSKRRTFRHKNENPGIASLEMVALESVREARRASESYEGDKDELPCEENLDVKNFAIPKETMTSMAKDKPPTSVEDVRNKTNDQTNIVKTPVSLSRISSQRTGNDDSGSQIADIGNERDIGAVIGQVISERLFSSMSTSHRSSQVSCSVSSEDTENEQGKNVLLASNECENHVQHDHRIEATTDDIPFPNDGILIRLREQAHFYREHLRNIDTILETLDSVKI